MSRMVRKPHRWRRLLPLLFGIAALCILARPMRADEINISQFVFLDSNANGIYERGEHALAGVQVMLEVNGELILTESNLNGFANFAMGLNDEAAEITAPGEGRTRAVVPEGMMLTTGNSQSETSFRALPGSIAGLIADPPLPFVGLAILPRLTLVAPAVAAGTEIRCESGESRLIAERDAVGRPFCDIPPEQADQRWRLSAGAQGPDYYDGVPGFRNIAVLAPTADPGPLATGESLTESFDGLIRASTIEEMPMLDSGLAFHGLIAVHRLFYGGPGYVNGTSSGEFAAYSSSGHPATLRRDGGFAPLSMELSYAWPGAASGEAAIEAFRGGESLGAATLPLSHLYPTTAIFGWGLVDRLVLSHQTYWQILVDDLRYRLP